MDYIEAKQILIPTQDRFWFGSEYTMDLYEGCDDGNIYCDSRSNYEDILSLAQVKIKKNALDFLQDELEVKEKKGIVATGCTSDPYNSYELNLRLTRQSLELLDHFGFGVSIVTKSHLVTRDIDLFQKIRAHSPVICGVTITSGDDELAKKLEPNAPSSSERFAAVERLVDAGIYTGILVPILPFLTDTEESVMYLVHKAREVGAKFVYPTMGITLEGNQKTYFYEQLDKKFPGVRELYEKEYGENSYCGSKNSITLFDAIKQECKHLGILYNMQQIVNTCKMQYDFDQISFLDHVDFFMS